MSPSTMTFTEELQSLIEILTRETKAKKSEKYKAKDWLTFQLFFLTRMQRMCEANPTYQFHIPLLAALKQTIKSLEKMNVIL